MNPFWKQIVIQTVLKNRQHKEPEPYSDYDFARGFFEFKILTLSLVRDIFFMVLGIGSAAFGLESFLLPSNFIDGGATGISLLISTVSGIPLYWLLVIINIPFVFLGFKVINRAFAVKTALSITGLAVCVATVHFPEVTHDKFLVAVFGGFFLGAGIGMSIRGGAVLDGTEVLAISLSRKLGTTVGDVIIMVNVIIFSAAAYLLSIENALYSMVTYLAASKTLDFVIEGIEEYTGVTIVSVHNEEIKQMIVNTMGRGVTVYSGKQGFGKKGEKKDMDILYTVVTRLELNKLNTEIIRIDKYAFVVMSAVKDTRGGMIKKRPLEH